jgi:hypothetical protein
LRLLTGLLAAANQKTPRRPDEVTVTRTSTLGRVAGVNFESSSQLGERAKLIEMQRVLTFVVAAIWSEAVLAIAAQPTMASEYGEPWLSEDDVAPQSVFDESGLEQLTFADEGHRATAGTRWTECEDFPRFESGLEEDALVTGPNVFRLSGLEGLTCMTDDRFGSGLEEDAPWLAPDPLHLSGLEERSNR